MTPTPPETPKTPGSSKTPKTPETDPAVARFWMLQLMRLGGVLLVFGGMLILSGKVTGPDVLGYGLIVLGAFEFFALPAMVAKRWKSPDA